MTSFTETLLRLCSVLRKVFLIAENGQIEFSSVEQEKRGIAVCLVGVCVRHVSLCVCGVVIQTPPASRIKQGSLAAHKKQNC